MYTIMQYTNIGGNIGWKFLVNILSISSWVIVLENDVYHEKKDILIDPEAGTSGNNGTIFI